MSSSRSRVALAAVLLIAGLLPPAVAQEPAASGATFTPQFAQPGKDVVWVPSPNETVELMLDVAGVTARDLVVDLGSGDGRTVIAAAKRGARGRGIEYNPDMVALSRREALRAGVADRVRFEQGDMYEADVSDADVLALFLLTENLRKLAPTFLALRPGTRIVSNTFVIPGWTPEKTVRREEPCQAWCAVMLYVVPAHVEGTWQTDDGVLRLAQQVQQVGGELVAADGTAHPLTAVHLRGAAFSFTVRDASYQGTVKGNVMTGTRQNANGKATPWRATRTP